MLELGRAVPLARAAGVRALCAAAAQDGLIVRGWSSGAGARGSPPRRGPPVSSRGGGGGRRPGGEGVVVGSRGSRLASGLRAPVFVKGGSRGARSHRGAGTR